MRKKKSAKHCSCLILHFMNRLLFQFNSDVTYSPLRLVKLKSIFILTDYKRKLAA